MHVSEAAVNSASHHHGTCGTQHEGAADIKPGIRKSSSIESEEAEEILKGSEGSCCFSRQIQVHKFYLSWPVQSLFTFFIMTCFLMECAQRQIDPSATQWHHAWTLVETFFTIVFLIELLINMYGNWMWPFLRHAWNYLDILVVAIGILVICEFITGPLRLVRMLRVFRVFRLFGRIESLRKILISLSRALPGVLNAFLIMILVVCIYAVLAVDLFKGIYGDCKSSDVPAAITPRGYCWGDEYYGNFFKSLYTLFQVLTGDSWSEMGVKPSLLAATTVGFDVFMFPVFFVSFVVINAIVLLNVVVAVLLDKMNGVEEDATEVGTKTSIEDDNGGQDGHVDIVPAPHWTKDESSLVTQDSKHSNGPSSEIATLRGEMASMQTQLDTIQADVRELLLALGGPGTNGGRVLVRL